MQSLPSCEACFIQTECPYQIVHEEPIVVVLVVVLVGVLQTECASQIVHEEEEAQPFVVLVVVCSGASIKNQ